MILDKVGEDYDQWGIHILVRFREGEILHLLDSERQSGGVGHHRECSFGRGAHEFSLTLPSMRYRNVP